LAYILRAKFKHGVTSTGGDHVDHLIEFFLYLEGYFQNSIPFSKLPEFRAQIYSG